MEERASQALLCVGLLGVGGGEFDVGKISVRGGGVSWLWSSLGF